MEPCKRKYDREVTALLNDLKGGKFNVKEGSKGKRRTLLGVVKATKILKKAPPSDEKSQVNQHSDNEEANQKEILNENDQIDNEGGDKGREKFFFFAYIFILFQGFSNFLYLRKS